MFFLLGAIVSGAAKNFVAMLAGRALQGVGAGGIVAAGDIVVTDLVELRLRGKWFGYLSIMWAIGTTTGPIIGGAFATPGMEISIIHGVIMKFVHADNSLKICGNGFSGSISLWAPFHLPWSWLS